MNARQKRQASIIAPDFRESLRNLNELETTTDTVYGLSPDLCLSYMNPGWFRFAQENAGEPDISRSWGLGRPIFDSIPAELHSFFRTLYENVLNASPLKDRFPASYEYECSSAETYRRFAMLVYPLSGKGLLVVNSPILARPHDPATRPAHDPDVKIYADVHGMIHQCAHCRRIENISVKGRWDWVPEWVKRIPPRTSHTLCNYCYEIYYQRISDTSDGV